MTIRFCIAEFCLLGSMPLWSADISLRIEPFDSSQTSVTINDASDMVEIHGSAAMRLMPSVERGPISWGKTDWVLEWEYFCVGDVDESKISPGPTHSPLLSQPLPTLAHRESFGHYAARIRTGASGWPETSRDVRLDLRMHEDDALQIRSVQIRPAKPGEFGDGDSSTTADKKSFADSQSIEDYLSQTFDAKVNNVSVGNTEIMISGSITGNIDAIFLADIPIETLVNEQSRVATRVPVSVAENGTFTVTVPRSVMRGEQPIDRLTSRWQLVRLDQGNAIPISHARYADEVACRTPYSSPSRPSTRKGLGGWNPTGKPSLKNEVEDLGISAVTVNIFPVHQFVSTSPKPGSTRFTYQGRTYYANERSLERFDQIFREAQRLELMVSAILLVDNPANSNDLDAKLLGHPDAVREGTFAMPNLTSAEGIAYYGAILNLITERWSSDDGVHGRVHQWIIHNEVDFGWVWTNAGRKTDVEYMDLYQRSLRMTDLIARQYDPNAHSWISLTHHWSEKGNDDGYGSKRLLELLARYCSVEGDFPWALAFHPYPQNLFNPRTWEDNQATFRFDTPKITPNNLEVLDAFMKRPEMLYRGQVRPIHLSENGFNSKDYSPRSLEDQAAGMALAWKKMNALSSIQCWHYHNWIDNRHEGGLKIGLRKFADDEQDPLGKKPIWSLFEALGTPREDAVAAPYLKTIGIESWDDTIHREPIN